MRLGPAKAAHHGSREAMNYVSSLRSAGRQALQAPQSALAFEPASYANPGTFSEGGASRQRDVRGLESLLCMLRLRNLAMMSPISASTKFTPEITSESSFRVRVPIDVQQLVAREARLLACLSTRY